MSPTESFLIAFAAIAGAMVGSFLNVCVWRLPRRGLSIFSPPRSHCPSCGAAIPWHDNLPLIGYIVLGGRCRSCRAPFSLRYFTVEGLTALLFAIIATLTLAGGEPRWGEFLVLAALAAALVVACFVDIDLRIIPDEITLPGMAAIPFVAVAVPGLFCRLTDGFLWDALASSRPLWTAAHDALPEALRGGAGLVGGGAALAAAGAACGLYGYRAYWLLAHRGEPGRLRDGAVAAAVAGSALAAAWVLCVRPEAALHPRIVALATALAGMGAGAGLVLAVGIAGTIVFRKEAMGFGDVKLMGLLGGFTGWGGVLAAFAMACLLGSIVGIARLVRYRTRYLPFGPFLSLGALAVILFPAALRRGLDWYLALFR